MYDYGILVIAVGAFAYALGAARLQRLWITGPMVFTAFGLACGPQGFDLVDFRFESTTVELVVQVTLGLTLFLDATRVDYGDLRRRPGLPVRLLTVALPIVIVVGALLALPLFPDLNGWEVAALAAVLAPTDAVLGKAIIDNPVVPGRVRRALSVESGLNDGIALSVLTVVISSSRWSSDGDPVSELVSTIAEEVGIGVGVGVAVGFVGGWLYQAATDDDRLGDLWSAIAMLAVPAAAYGLAAPLHGSGFLATYVAGVVFAVGARGRLRHHPIETDETIVEALTMAVFAVFGAVMLGDALDRLTWEIVLYAALSLTMVRGVGVAVSLVRSGENLRTQAILAWFGPRGLASILFLAVVLRRRSEEIIDLDVINDVAVWTIALSIVAHGVSSFPLARRYGEAEATADGGGS